MTRTPDAAKASFQRAVDALRSGDAAGAEREARAALGQYPDEPNFLAVLGSALNRLHRAGEAEAVLRRAIAIDPARAGGHVALANALARSSRADEAIASYRRAQEIRPDNAEIALGLGNVLKTIGRQAEAIAAYRDGIRLRPDFAELYWSLANLKTFRFEPGEVADRPGVTQSDIAATMLQYLGLDHRDFNPDGGPPIPGSLKPRE